MSGGRSPLARVGKRALGCRVVRYGRLGESLEGCARPWPPGPAFIARGEQNFTRFAAVLNDSLRVKDLAHRRAAHDRGLFGGGARAFRRTHGLPVANYPESLIRHRSDFVGHYEGDMLVIDTVGFRLGPFAMVDIHGTQYTELCMSWNVNGSSITKQSASRRSCDVPIYGAQSHTPRKRCVRFLAGVAVGSRNTRFQAAC
jgi:hypothetical protein